LTTLEGWLSKVKAANNSQEVFQLLSEFRKGEWTDEDCSLMSKAYIGVLGKFDKVDFADTAKAVTTKNAAANSSATQNAAGTNEETEEILVDEEVWYEKM
jgi:hypothetical protein